MESVHVDDFFPRFQLGACIVSQGVHLLQKANSESCELTPFLIHHQNGNWGDVCEDDKTSNDEAVLNGDRIMSTYQFNDKKIWIITEHDRSVTTVLLPSEY